VDRAQTPLARFLHSCGDGGTRVSGSWSEKRVHTLPSLWADLLDDDKCMFVSGARLVLVWGKLVVRVVGGNLCLVTETN